MFANLTVFATAHALADHATRAESLIARNIANADTPGYRAQRLAAFETAYSGSPSSQRATRPGHMRADPIAATHVVDAGTEPSPNGNSVSLEDEMLASAAAQRDHQEALLVYRHALGLLRSALGRS